MKRHFTIALLFSCIAPLRAAEEWVRLTTPHFELLTTAGEKKGREAALYFEEVRSFFLQALTLRGAPDTPVRIVAFRSEKQYKPYRYNEAAFAYYTKTRMRDYIVMEDIAPEHYKIAIHEYTHLIIENAGLKLPVWLNEGWAELYSTLKPLGKKAMIGDLIPGRVQTLLTAKWIDLATLTSVGRDSPLYNEKSKAGMFYAESWALAHMLYLAPEYHPNFGRFVFAISSGKAAAQAFETVYGRSIEDVGMDLRSYLRRNRLMGAVFNVSLRKSEEDAEASAPSSFDVDLTLADLLAATHRTEEATQEYGRLAKENPDRPEVQESLGYLAWQERDVPQARNHFGKALAADGKDARMCFDYAMLERRPGGNLESHRGPRTRGGAEARIQRGAVAAWADVSDGAAMEQGAGRACPDQDSEGRAGGRAVQRVSLRGRANGRS